MDGGTWGWGPGCGWLAGCTRVVAVMRRGAVDAAGLCGCGRAAALLSCACLMAAAARLPGCSCHRLADECCWGAESFGCDSLHTPPPSRRPGTLCTSVWASRARAGGACRCCWHQVSRSALCVWSLVGSQPVGGLRAARSEMAQAHPHDPAPVLWVGQALPVCSLFFPTHAYSGAGCSITLAWTSKCFIWTVCIGCLLVGRRTNRRSSR